MNTTIIIAFWKQFGIPQPKLEFPFVPGRKFRADFAWPEYGLILECEGGIWIRGKHGRPSGIKSDMVRGNFAAEYGYRMLRFEPKELLLTKTAETILRALNPKTPLDPSRLELVASEP